MFLTFKAEFVNGSIKFTDKVPFDGACDVLVTFITDQDIFSSLKFEHKEELVGFFKSSFFTDRELEVLRYIQKGFTNKEIASSLGICHGTARNYVSCIFKKLKVRNRSEAISKGIELGLINPPVSYW